MQREVQPHQDQGVPDHQVAYLQPGGLISAAVIVMGGVRVAVTLECNLEGGSGKACWVVLNFSGPQASSTP